MFLICLVTQTDTAMKRKKIGIIGGMGARAGMLLFKSIIEKSPAITDQEFMEVILHSNSGIPDRTQAILYNGESPLPELLRSVNLLNTHGVDYIASACVTSYYYYEQMKTHSGAPLLHPVQLMVQHIQQQYGQHALVGILATSGTISTGLFQQALTAAGLNYVTLPPDLQENGFMKAVYMENGLKSAVISSEAKTHFHSCLQYLDAQQVNVIIGGCTEVAIVAEEFKSRYPLVNILEVLADEAIRLGYSN